jgi:hypothetical protein
MDASSESGKAKGALVGKGRGAPHGAGRGPFVYGGAAGNMAISQGDPNFPAFLPGLYILQKLWKLLIKNYQIYIANIMEIMDPVYLVQLLMSECNFLLLLSF